MHVRLWKNGVVLATLNYSFLVLHAAHRPENLIRRDKQRERFDGRRRRVEESYVKRHGRSMRHHARLEVAASGVISGPGRGDDEAGQLDDEEERHGWRHDILEQRQNRQHDHLEQWHGSHRRSRHCIRGHTIEARFRFQSLQQLMTLGISRANADVVQRLVNAGLTPDQVAAFDNTGHLDGWDGPDIRIVSNGKDMPLGSFEDAVSDSHARKLFPLDVAWRFHCVMQEFPVVSSRASREVSLGENNHHIRKKQRWLDKITRIFKRRRASPAAAPSPTEAPGVPFGSSLTTPTTTAKMGFFKKIGHAIKKGWKKIKEKAVNGWKKIKEKATNVFHKVKHAIAQPGGLKNLGPVLASGFQEIKNTTSQVTKEVGASIANTSSNFLTQVSSLQASLAGGTMNFSEAFNKVIGLADKAVISSSMTFASGMQKEEDKVNSVQSTETSAINSAISETNNVSTAFHAR